MTNGSNNATLLPGTEPMRHPLHGGQRYQLTDMHTTGLSLSLVCSDVAQRNWSRVATGLIEEREDTGHRRLFLKQYVDRTGQWNENLWTYERSGVQIAQEVLGKHIGIPRLIVSDLSHLINAFEHADMLSMDELLRADSSAFERAFPVALGCMAEVLEILHNPEFETRFHLSRKNRNFGGSDVGLNFKGFEFRNLGVSTEALKEPTREDFFLFDFVRPYMAPIQEAAAKSFVSIGLLNWGHPLSRFSKGPDFQLLEVAKQHLAPYLDRKAVEAELRLQRSFRWAEIHGAGTLERSVKRLAISTLGGRYFHRMENWCRSALR